MLESVNSLLASGEVPGLYTQEELDPLLAPIKDQMGESALAFRTPYDFFVYRVRHNLRICVAMDPHHADFASRCERNPALFTRCAILWMGAWARPSLRSVAGMLMAELAGPLGAHLPIDAVVDMLVAVHDGSSAVAMGGGGAAAAGGAALAGRSPRDFTTLVRTYRGVYVSKVGGRGAEVDRLKAGLGKLLDAQATVDDLTRNAAAQREQLRTKQAAADKAMNDITEALSLASDRKREVEVLQVRRRLKGGDGGGGKWVYMSNASPPPPRADVPGAGGEGDARAQGRRRGGALVHHAHGGGGQGGRRVHQAREPRRDQVAQGAARGHRGRALGGAHAPRDQRHVVERHEEVPGEPRRQGRHPRL